MAQLVKSLPAMQEAPGSIPGLGRSPGEERGYPLQYSGPENFMDCIVHGVTKSQTQLSDYQFISFSSTEMVITTSNVGKKEPPEWFMYYQNNSTELN